MLSYQFIAAYDHLLGKGLGSRVCYVFLCFVTFLYSVLGQVWYLVVSIPDPGLPLFFTFTLN